MDDSRSDGLVVISVFLAALALIAAVIGVGIAAVDAGDGDGGDDSAGDATLDVDLTDEFAITPDPIEVAAGASLHVTNSGALEHNLAVKDSSLATEMLAGGGEGDLDLSGLEPGTYTVFCEVPGHETAGMTAEMVIAEGASAGEGGHGTGKGAMSADQMDANMAVRTKAFPAKTEGLGAQPLEPKVLANGTKEFELTTSVIDWEIEPGKTVKAWTYNEQVPGPTISVDTGDRVRVVLHNELEESTSIHFHGVHTPNAMDGVPDITQPPVKPGETFVYEFVAKDPAVGMYHSHHDAAVQVPNGLAGAFLIGDLPLPAGVAVAGELPMMLNDAGTIGFSLNGKSFPATAPVAAARDSWTLVHYLNEGVQVHPMHLHGLDQLVVAKDGFPLATPQLMDTVTVAPGERWSVLVRATEPGVWAWHCHILPHAEREDGMFGMVTAMVVE